MAGVTLGTEHHATCWYRAQPLPAWTSPSWGRNHAVGCLRQFAGCAPRPAQEYPLFWGSEGLSHPLHKGSSSSVSSVDPRPGRFCDTCSPRAVVSRRESQWTGWGSGAPRSPSGHAVVRGLLQTCPRQRGACSSWSERELVRQGLFQPPFPRVAPWVPLWVKRQCQPQHLAPRHLHILDPRGLPRTVLVFPQVCSSRHLDKVLKLQCSLKVFSLAPGSWPHTRTHGHTNTHHPPPADSTSLASWEVCAISCHISAGPTDLSWPGPALPARTPKATERWDAARSNCQALASQAPAPERP